VGNRSPWPVTRPSLLAQMRQTGSEEVWQTFVATYAPLVYRYCRARGLQDADAQDVTQDVIFKVRNFEYDPARGRFRSWLAKVTLREIWHYRARLNRPGQGVGGDDPWATVDHEPVLEEEVDWKRFFHACVLEKALEQIRPEFSEAEWQVFQAVAVKVVDGPDGKYVEWVEQPDPAEVARTLGKPVAWVYKVKSLVQKRLKEEILYLAEELGVLV
jgi:RNA polymerase sigma factor (sigma-70 family)